MELTPEIATKLVGFIKNSSSLITEQAQALQAAASLGTKSAEKTEGVRKAAAVVVDTLVAQGLCPAERRDAKIAAYLGDNGQMLMLGDLQKAAGLVTAQKLGGPAGAGPVDGALSSTEELSAEDAFERKLMSARQG